MLVYYIRINWVKIIYNLFTKGKNELKLAHFKFALTLDRPWFHTTSTGHVISFWHHLETLFFRWNTWSWSMRYLNKQFLMIQKINKQIKTFAVFRYRLCISYHLGEPCDSCNNVSDVKVTSPALGGGKAYHINFWGL